MIKVEAYRLTSINDDLLYLFTVLLTSENQVYPSEYAYQDNHVNRAERISANCRNYPPGNHQPGIHPEHYIHCDGTKLKLADSDLGEEQYSSGDFYVWSPGTKSSSSTMLFTLPTRVSLTTITLHYYSDSVQGLPRLTLYAVPDNFKVWDSLGANKKLIDVATVPPGTEPVGRRNISVDVNLNTKKVLMYKYGSTFQFAVSEMLLHL